MLSVFIAIISGAAMSIQGVFNTRVTEKIGLWETNTIVHGSAFILTLMLMFTIGKGNLFEIKSTNKLYLLGGIIGVIITYTVIKTVGNLGPTCGISIILIAQLATAAIIDGFGLFGTPKTNFSFNEFAGVAIMVVGVVVFKWKCR